MLRVKSLWSGSFAEKPTPIAKAPWFETRKIRTRKESSFTYARVYAYCAAAVSLVVVLGFFFLDGLPWGGKPTACTLKEFRITGAWYGKLIDQVSQESLKARTKLCDIDANAYLNSHDLVTVGFIDWVYHDDDVRPEYARTNSITIPKPAESCSSWCSMKEVQTVEQADNVDLVMLNPSDHGRAFAVTWCKHDYPQPFMINVHARSRRIRQTADRRQYWGIWTYEHIRQFPQIADPTVLKNIDMTMSYRSDSDVRMSWFCADDAPEGFNDYYKMPKLEKKKYLLSIVGSRCRNDWSVYVEELSLYINDANFQKYGGCWGYKNRIPEIDRNPFKNKIRELSKSKFIMVFENSNEISSYVTEKLSHALLAGAVPVIWGAPDVQEFLPGNHSAILVTGKTIISPKALAEKLFSLDRDDQKYMEYFSWKNEPRNPEFQRLVDLCYLNSGCRLCEWVRKKRICDSIR